MLNIILIGFLSMTIVYSQPSCDHVPFVDRAGWGADPPKAITNLTSKPLSFYVVHHSESPPR